MQQQIQSYYALLFPDWQDLRVTDPHRIATGWETEIFSFDVDYTFDGQTVHEGVIMRMYPSNNAYEKSAKEFSDMKQLREAGYPVPQLFHLEREESPWSKPFILMERIEGEIMWPKLIHSSGQNQESLLTLFCELFVRLHNLDWRTFAGNLSHNDLHYPYQFIDNKLYEGAEQLARFEQTGFLPVFDWLQERRDDVPCARPSPIHFDYHPGNILLLSDGTAVVLDWSGFEISDARFDLAWTIVLISAYEGATWRERILQTYEQLAGAPVEQIEYFEVYACVRRLFIIAATLQSGAEKLGMDPSAVNRIKEQMFAHKRVYDRLREITGIRVSEAEEIYEVDS